MAGTRWVQTELLEKYPKANLRVYAIWFNMMANDSRAKWPATLLPDSRVIHQWDERKAVGRWYAPRTAALRPQLSPGSQWGNGDVLWDAFLLYGSDSRWDDAPTGLIHWGRTIVAGRETLKADFEKLFGGTASAKVREHASIWRWGNAKGNSLRRQVRWMNQLRVTDARNIEQFRRRPAFEVPSTRFRAWIWSEKPSDLTD